ncbi:MAG: family 2 glycosyltransferase SpsQ [Candidatus Scalindua rubra]|uniref:Family 2 glycosyltransferase SpsQ n=1 Tax=Candidatus Scalindua rubra TaxID=1872076 RepID=A0A1E3X4N8_9BACT|nr:MAG: family 2 glycosyltransferase SpsQ [Candidatus Scalindua rubra]
MEKQVDEQKYHSVIDPLVTVVIPTYNEEKSIEDCVRSLRNQTIPLEIIVVDDGSKDQTVAICEAIGVKALRQSHKGPGTARNLGAKNAKGNILVFVDADMLFAADYISKLIEPIISGETIATCHWNEMVTNWHNPWARCQTWYFGHPDKRRTPYAVHPPGNVYRAVRKVFFLDSGGFAENEGRGDDGSVARRTGVKAKRVTDAICYHRNAEGPGDIYSDAVWRGRHKAVHENGGFRRCVSIVLIHGNPVRGILRGLLLAVDKKEPRMVLYSIIYNLGYTLGVLRALYSGYYLK